MILADGLHLRLAYYLEQRADESTNGEPVALVQFAHAYAHMFGPPNDEAFAGHPLASRGLRRYGVHEIRESSWVRRLERMNAVHPLHRPERFARYRHFVFAFHDTTFECIAESFSATVHSGSVAEVLQKAQ